MAVWVAAAHAASGPRPVCITQQSLHRPAHCPASIMGRSVTCVAAFKRRARVLHGCVRVDACGCVSMLCCTASIAVRLGELHMAPQHAQNMHYFEGWYSRMGALVALNQPLCTCQCPLGSVARLLSMVLLPCTTPLDHLRLRRVPVFLSVGMWFGEHINMQIMFISSSYTVGLCG
jgi:hypothetical protein